MERVKGIEPSYAAWEAAVLPLNYTRMQGGFYSSSCASQILGGNAITDCPAIRQ